MSLFYSQEKTSKKGRGKRIIKVQVFVLILFLHEMLTVDTADESVYRPVQILLNI